MRIDLLQLFRQRLCSRGVKPYATMPTGKMTSNRLPLLDWGSRCFSKKQGEKFKYKCAYYLLFVSRWNIASIGQRWTAIIHDTFRHCRIRNNLFQNSCSNSFHSGVYLGGRIINSKIYWNLVLFKTIMGTGWNIWELFWMTPDSF